MPKAIRFNPTGGMNLDDDVRYLNNGDYRIALGVRHVSDKDGNSISVEDVLGNEFAFTLGETFAQNKIFRIYLDSTAAFNYSWNVLNGVGRLLTSVSTTTVAGNIAATISAAIAAFSTQLTIAGQFYNPITSQVTAANQGYIQIEIITIAGWEYEIQSTGATESKVVISQEAHDTSLSGENIAIGGAYLLDELWLWVTSRKELQEKLPLTITNISDNGSGVIVITTNLPHGLISGNAVSISGSPANSNANGIWIAQVTGPTTFLLPGSQFLNNSSGGTITTNVYGAGAIIVAVHVFTDIT